MSRQDTDLNLRHIADALNASTVAKRVDSDKLFFIDLADMHVGAKLAEPKFIKDKIAKIAKLKEVYPTASIVTAIGGDSTDHATLKAGKGSPYDQSSNGLDQVIELRDILKPIKDTIAVVRSGNHGAGRAKKLDNMIPERVLAEFLEVPYVEGIATLILNARKNMYTVTIQHNNKFATAFQWLHSDINIIEHKHQSGFNTEIVAGINGFTKTYSVRERYTVYAGSSLAYGGYAAEAGYKPTQLGWPVIELSGEVNKWKIKVHTKIEDLL